ncbi:MAG: SpaH/EbpB family LPXTG-anchored major pilin [Butyricicoccus sp.]
MKKTNQWLATVLALVMVFTLTSTAFAATVTVPSDGILKAHTFTAYQVFSGREEGGVLSDVQWGSGIDSTNFLAALKADTTYGSLFTDCDSAAKVAKVLGDNNSNTALANKVAELAYKHKTGSGTALTAGENTLADGYYLVVDTTETVGAGSAYNKALLQVVGNIDITVKTDAPTVDKSVTDSDENDGNAADYNIGDNVPFKLIGSVPDMSRYDTYKYIFHDTLSTGLTLNESSIKVYVASSSTGTDKAEITGWTKAVAGQSFTISFTDLKTVSNVSQGKYIIVEYTAKLNGDAVIGSDGNPNTVYLEYSNKPDQSGSGDNNTGNTPKDEVLVFTYELDVTKVDGQDKSELPNAEFVLLNSDQTKVAKIADGKFVKWVDDSTITKNTDGTYPADYTLKSNADGKFQIAGLDAGTYYLKETKAPAGYNLLENPITIVISATLDTSETNPALTALTIKVDNGEAKNGDLDSGVVATNVENNKGATLPETGGIGTTIFYVLGGALVIGAAVLLITKKRMNAEK